MTAQNELPGMQEPAPVLMESQEQIAENAVNAEIQEGYAPTEDNDKPDFAMDDLMESIKTCIYMELPLWKKKILNMQSNLQKNYEIVKSIPKLSEVVESDEFRQGLSADQIVEAENELQRRGGEVEMRLQSIIDKYDVNMAGIDELLAVIDERMEKEKSSVESATTSQKTEMLKQMVINNVNKTLEKFEGKETPETRKLVKYKDALLGIYDNREDIDWLCRKINDGTSFPAIYRQYKKLIQSDPNAIQQHVKRSFGFDYIPFCFKQLYDEKIIFRKSSMTEEQFIETLRDINNFLYYYLSFTVFTKVSKHQDLRGNLLKEQVIIVFQNIGDCCAGAFDINPDNDPDMTNRDLGNQYLLVLLMVASKIYEKATAKTIFTK